MSILLYNNFLDELKLIESMKEMNFVLSSRFIDVLNKINHEISDKLKELNNDPDSSKRQTFIDICEDKDDSVTFIQANKATELLGIENDEQYKKFDKNQLHSINYLTHPVYKQHRSEMKLGRFINNIFGSSAFPASSRTEPGVKPNDVESFVNMYKAIVKKDEKFALMDIVSGRAISHWYNHNNYKNSNGSLGSSCMSEVSSRYFDIYTQNPNVSMVILYSDNNKSKICGRAILWKDLILPEGRTYMDRIYTNNSGDESLFKEFAKSKGWLYKSHQGYGSSSYIDDPVNNSSTMMILKSQLLQRDFSYYPYMDTMVYYNPNNGIISNRERGMRYELLSTGGGHSTLSRDVQDDVMVHSNYENCDIYQSEATWCDFGQDWVRTEHAIRVWNDTRFAVPGCPDVVRSHIPGFVDKYWEKKRCTWSDFANTWIFNGAKIEAWTDLDRTNYNVDYKKRSGVTYVEINNEFWDINLAHKTNGRWVLNGTPSPLMTRPINPPKGWHKMKEYVDEQGNIFRLKEYKDENGNTSMKSKYSGKKQI